eukprot:scaffold1146_cov399-Prasinococcus_capsulatus_cf.AAC.88
MPGGTYMTLLNTISNLGGKWTTTVAIWALDFYSFDSLLAVSTVLGAIWLILGWRTTSSLQATPIKQWHYGSARAKNAQNTKPRAHWHVLCGRSSRHARRFTQSAMRSADCRRHPLRSEHCRDLDRSMGYERLAQDYLPREELPP